MVSPTHTEPVDSLLLQLKLLLGLLRSTCGVPACPQALMKQACLRMEDAAYFNHTDIMRSYKAGMPRVRVDAEALTSLLADIVRTSIIASGNINSRQRGAVVCDLFYRPEGLRFSISDSSGRAGGEGWQEAWQRYEDLDAMRLRASAMGAQFLMGLFPGEGVVVELLFPSTLCVSGVDAVALAANDDRAGALARSETLT